MAIITEYIISVDKQWKNRCNGLQVNGFHTRSSVWPISVYEINDKKCSKDKIYKKYNDEGVKRYFDAYDTRIAMC